MNIGLLGFGVVGGGVWELAADRQDVNVKRVLLRRPKDGLPAAVTTMDINDILCDDTIDTVVEVMGGLHPAYEYVTAAMERGITDITQKGRQLLFSFDGRIDPSALLAVCTMAAYRSRTQLTAGASPRLTLYLQPKEEPLAAAGGLVDALRLHEKDTQQADGASPRKEETAHEK